MTRSVVLFVQQKHPEKHRRKAERETREGMGSGASAQAAPAEAATEAATKVPRSVAWGVARALDRPDDASDIADREAALGELAALRKGVAAYSKWVAGEWTQEDEDRDAREVAPVEEGSPRVNGVQERGDEGSVPLQKRITGIHDRVETAPKDSGDDLTVEDVQTLLGPTIKEARQERSTSKLQRRKSREAIDMVVGEMQKRRGSVTMQWIGCECLAELTAGDALTRSELAASGGAGQIYVAMTCNPHNSRILHKGAWAIANGCPDHELVYIDAGCVEALMVAAEEAAVTARKITEGSGPANMELSGSSPYDAVCARIQVICRGLNNLAKVEDAATAALQASDHGPRILAALKESLGVVPDQMTQYRIGNTISLVEGMVQAKAGA